MLHIVFSWRSKSKIKHIVLNPYILLSEPACIRPVADFNEDNVVDWHDLAYFVEQWATRCVIGDWCGDRDINHDCKVNLHDFGVFASQWFQRCQ